MVNGSDVPSYRSPWRGEWNDPIRVVVEGPRRRRVEDLQTAVLSASCCGSHGRVRRRRGVRLPEPALRLRPPRRRGDRRRLAGRRLGRERGTTLVELGGAERRLHDAPDAAARRPNVTVVDPHRRPRRRRERGRRRRDPGRLRRPSAASCRSASSSGNLTIAAPRRSPGRTAATSAASSRRASRSASKVRVAARRARAYDGVVTAVAQRDTIGARRHGVAAARRHLHRRDDQPPRQPLAASKATATFVERHRPPGDAARPVRHDTGGFLGRRLPRGPVRPRLHGQGHARRGRADYKIAIIRGTNDAKDDTLEFTTEGSFPWADGHVADVWVTGSPPQATFTTDELVPAADDRAARRHRVLACRSRARASRSSRPRSHLLSQLRGPLAVEGGVTGADRSLKNGIKLPGETDRT